MSDEIRATGNTDSPWLITLAAADNALAPVITKGASVEVDCSERDLVDGGIYAIKTNGKVDLWLFHEGFAGVGPLASGEEVGTLTSLAGRFRSSGPLATADIKVIGRLAADVATPVIGRDSAERGLLLAALDECRNALRRHAGGMREWPLTDGAKAGDTVAIWRRRYEGVVADTEAHKRYALEQRIDALNARLMFLEDRIADAEANSVADVAAKLRVLWDLHHAPFPATHDDLSARIVATALRGLGEHDDRPADGTDEDDNASAGPAIKLVSSPRRR